MTLSKKSFLMTLLSLALIVCSALGLVLSTPASVRADTPDYLSWERTEAKEGDILAFRYVLIDVTKMGNGSIIIFDQDTADRDNGRCYGRLHFVDGKLKGRTASGEEYVEMSCVLSQSPYFVYYIMPYVLSNDSNAVKPLTQYSELSNSETGMYFLNDNGATTPDVPDEPEQPSTTTLPEFSGANYNAVYLKAGDTFDNKSYLCVPEGAEFLLNFVPENPNLGPNIHNSSENKILVALDFSNTFEIEPSFVTNRYGVKSYVYDVSSLPEGLVIKDFAGVNALDVYMLTLKDGAEPEVPQPSNPGDGGNTEDPGSGDDTENPGNGGNTTDPNEGEQKDIWDKARDFFTKLGEGINENTGVAIGSTGALILFAVVLYLIFRR